MSVTAVAHGIRRKPRCWRLKALLAGTGRPLASDRPPHVEIRCDGKLVRELVVPTLQADVVQQIDLSSLMSVGKHRLALVNRSDTAAVYQTSISYCLPEAEEPGERGPLGIQIAYDKTELYVNDVVALRARVVNQTSATAPMVILDLPIPAGFAVAPEDFDELTAAGTIAKYQLTPRSAVVYLRQLLPAEPLVLHYRLRATMPVKITTAPARAYEYYDPDKQVASAVAHLTVTARER